jgi:hypothetical protein
VACDLHVFITMHYQPRPKATIELPDETTEMLEDEEASEPEPETSGPFPEPHSGTLSSVRDSERLPVVDTGLSIDPEDLGIQFLRDATDQDNFESYVAVEEIEPGIFLSQVAPGAMHQGSLQEIDGVPQSGTGRTRQEMTELEPESLFDRPTGSGD